MIFTPNSNGADECGLNAREAELYERWSDEARAAALAARRSKSRGGDWRKVARDTYLNALSFNARQAIKLGDPAVGHDSKAGAYDTPGQSLDRAERAARHDRVKRAGLRRALKGRCETSACQARRMGRFAPRPPSDVAGSIEYAAYGLSGQIPIPRGARLRPRLAWED